MDATNEPFNPSPIRPAPRPGKRRPPTNIRHSRPPKRRGEEGELAFMRRAIAEGFAVAKPWGDSERYDFILDNGARLWRVQVRSTDYEVHHGFTVHASIRVGRESIRLTSKDVDVIAAYLVPHDLWYIVPIDACTCKNLWFYPGYSPKGSRFEKFREAWDYLRAPAAANNATERDLSQSGPARQDLIRLTASENESVDGMPSLAAE